MISLPTGSRFLAAVLLAGLVALTCVKGERGVTGITAGTVATIGIIPETVSVSAAATQQFIAVGAEANGNELPITPTWSVLSGAGNIDSAGLFRADSATGASVIQARVGTVFGRATITITTRAIPPESLASLSIGCPNSSGIVVTSGTCQLAVRGRDLRGNLVPVVPIWSVFSGCGTITNSGLFTACASPGGATVEATAGGYTAFTALDVLEPGVPAHLVSLTQPEAVQVAGRPIAPAPRMALQDAAFNTILAFSGPVRIYLSCCDHWGQLLGTTTVNAVNGIATFEDLTITAPGGFNYSLEAEGGPPGYIAGTASFSVLAGTPSKLVFTIQPGGANSPEQGCQYVSPVEVGVQDSAGNAVATYADTIRLGIGSNPGGGTLSGNLVGTAFSGPSALVSGPGRVMLGLGLPPLRIDKPGIGYTLVATAPGLTSAVSVPFTVPVPPACAGF